MATNAAAGASRQLALATKARAYTKVRMVMNKFENHSEDGRNTPYTPQASGTPLGGYSQ